ncbi:MAG TPA: hypothetical protein VED40_14890 [Azospirillaceae bacterium]|nr:hypothetical protein [Azospirillaceae bacterium]
MPADAQDRTDVDEVRARTDASIDYSDIPPLSSPAWAPGEPRATGGKTPERKKPAA